MSDAYTLPKLPAASLTCLCVLVCCSFTEALTHTTLPWMGSHQRRSLLVRYAPGNLAYATPGPSGVSYEPWEDSMLVDGSAEYLSLLEPPMQVNHPLMDRPMLDDEGEVYYLREQEPEQRRPRWASLNRL